ncbi:class I SAM-dependent DNA methyltransferase [Tistrella mobilis]|uniref:class I SAM-dependent DNA methyltransferase n=1 Tax=Tistrella mobilis TaxID=171437 RepID=UPI0035591E5F
MNAVEIEEAVSDLAGAPFDAAEFPFAFLAAFGMKPTTIRRLRKGESNASDLAGGVLQRNNIHIAVCDAGRVDETLAILRASPKTTSAKAKFLLATDGVTFAAEDLAGGEVVVADYADLPRHFALFLPLAGISTVREIRENPFDIKATGRLNKLYLELLKENPDWGTEERRPALNQLMARLIFCFFAEDTGIFLPQLFTRTIEQMTDSRSGNIHEVLTELFRAMDTPPAKRAAGNFRGWADQFPYVNGGLFTDATDVPRFSRLARSYLLQAGQLNWQEINPDIFGSMIQAVADDAERGSLGMHYTSVPNILKVLNPLFLDELRDQLATAGDNPRRLRNLRRRLSRIRVFDPACGSGNFLVIAYKEMRAIEHEIIRRTGDTPRSMIRLENFYGIEIKSFAVEIARLALLIAEFQADCIYLSQSEARSMVLPLHKTGQIHVGNALRMNWLEVCPPPAKAVTVEHDLAGPTGRLALEETGWSDNEGMETYICGNPPYRGSKWQTADQKHDLDIAWSDYTHLKKTTDYVSGWFAKYLEYYSVDRHIRAAFVSTNSIVQGQQASEIWPVLFSKDIEIRFAHLPFEWRNLASSNAGVTVVIIGIGKKATEKKRLFNKDEERSCDSIGPYLIPNRIETISKKNLPISDLPIMLFGNMPRDGGHLFLTQSEFLMLKRRETGSIKYLRPFLGSDELINGLSRYCIWINDGEQENARMINDINERLDRVSEKRRSSTAESTRTFSDKPHRFVQIAGTSNRSSIVVPRVSSENRPYLPVGYVDSAVIIGDRNFAIYDSPLWALSVIASRLHLVWIATVCVRMRTDFSYSNTLGWNTFPVPRLTAQNKADLTRCAENILLVRERHFPATIAELYDPEKMPEDLRRAHDENDEVLERIYIGRRFRNDTERLEKLFDLYTRMTAGNATPDGRKKKGKGAA